MVLPLQKKKVVMDMTLNNMKWWGSSSTDLRNVEHSLVNITPRLSLNRSQNCVPLSKTFVLDMEVFTHFNDYEDKFLCNSWTW